MVLKAEIVLKLTFLLLDPDNQMTLSMMLIIVPHRRGACYVLPMRLFHFSEDPGIERFVPRPPLAHPEVEPLVWAIDDERQVMYYFPRDCPRCCFWPRADSAPEDVARLYAGVTAPMVIAIEARWLDALQSTTVYRYEMPPETFVLNDGTAGHWVSREPVAPLSVEPVDDLLGALVGTGVELRIMPSLVQLAREVVASTLEFSMTRMRNADEWEG
jgi:hypothetical protein